jgi:histidine triad (HIT) family protein
VYEDDETLAFLDINPKSPGHIQVIPKKHYRWVWDVEDIGKYFEVVKKLAKAQQKAFDTELIHSKIEGMDVHHAHIWIYPNADVSGDKFDFEKNSEIIRNSIL